MRAFLTAIIFLNFGLLSEAFPASLSVSPVIIDLTAPTATANIRLLNSGDKLINVQMRVFRWSQSGGIETLTPTTDVVASPPISHLKPGSENIVRIVRISKTVPNGEESYRLIVDELPNVAPRRSATVNLVIRHSIPVFFSKPDIADAAVSWRVTRQSDSYKVTLANKGAKRLRIADIALNNLNGKVIAHQKGLIGYVLSGSTVSFNIPITRSHKPNSSLTISATTETGTVRIRAEVSGG